MNGRVGWSENLPPLGSSSLANTEVLEKFGKQSQSTDPSRETKAEVISNESVIGDRWSRHLLMYLVIVLRLSEIFSLLQPIGPDPENQFKARNYPKTLRLRVGIDVIPGRQISSTIARWRFNREYFLLLPPAGHLETVW